MLICYLVASVKSQRLELPIIIDKMRLLLTHSCENVEKNISVGFLILSPILTVTRNACYINAVKCMEKGVWA